MDAGASRGSREAPQRHHGADESGAVDDRNSNNGTQGEGSHPGEETDGTPQELAPSSDRGRVEKKRRRPNRRRKAQKIREAKRRLSWYQRLTEDEDG